MEINLICCSWKCPLKSCFYCEDGYIIGKAICILDEEQKVYQLLLKNLTYSLYFGKGFKNLK